MKTVYEKSTGLTDVPLHYCPDARTGSFTSWSRNRSSNSMSLAAPSRWRPWLRGVCLRLFNCDAQEQPTDAHPPWPPASTRHPDAIGSVSGNGDLASIGTAEIVHAAMRGENITVVFVNNASTA